MNTQHEELAMFLSTWEAAETRGDASALGEVLADDFTAFGPLGFRALQGGLARAA